MSNETWIETAEKIALFRNQGKGGDAARLLEISQTNRTIASREQAVVLATLRFAADYYAKLRPEKKGYQWLGELCDNIERYQLTLDGEQNSRRQFMRVAISSISQFLKGNKNNNSENVTQ